MTRPHVFLALAFCVACRAADAPHPTVVSLAQPVASAEPAPPAEEKEKAVELEGPAADYVRACEADATKCVEAGRFLADVDEAEALRLFMRACDEVDDAMGCMVSANLLLEGDAGQQKKARSYGARACKLADFGCFVLGKLHRDGLGGPADADQARKLFLRACDAGYDEACQAIEALPPMHL